MMFVNLLAASVVVTIGLGAGELLTMEHVDEQAATAAEAVAHAAGGFLAGDPGRTTLSIDSQAGRASCQVENRTATGPNEGDECKGVLEVARRIARANGAVLDFFRVGSDTRDMNRGDGPGRLTVLVGAVISRHPPAGAHYCRDAPLSSALCYAHGWAAAGEAG